MNMRYFWNMYVRATMLGWYWELRERYTPTTCGYECHWVYPYGFVPEEGCPVHD